MVRFIIIICLLAGVSLTTAQEIKAQLSENISGIPIALVDNSYNLDLGSVKQGDIINHTLSFVNISSESLVLSNVESDGTLEIKEYTKKKIKPGAYCEIKIEWNTQGLSGYKVTTISIMTNLTAAPIKIRLAANIESLGVIAGGEQTTASFSETEFDFGELESGESFTHTFTITNTGVNPLFLSQVNVDPGLTTIDYTTESISPGNSGNIVVSLSSEGLSGLVSKVVHVNANTQPAHIHLKITGTIK